MGNVATTNLDSALPPTQSTFPELVEEGLHELGIAKCSQDSSPDSSSADKAATLLGQALQLAKLRGGAQWNLHEEVQLCWVRLGEALCVGSRFANAVKELQEVTVVLEEHRPDDSLTLESRYLWARAQFEKVMRGEGEEEELLSSLSNVRLCVQRQEILYNSAARPEVIKSRELVIDLMLQLKMLKEVVPLLESIIQDKCTTLGEKDPGVIHRIFLLATTLTTLQRYEDSLPHFERCLQLREEVLGEDHPETLKCMFCMARALELLGKKEDAYTLHLRCFRSRESQLGCLHEDTMGSFSRCCVLLRELTDERQLAEIREGYLRGLRAACGEEVPIKEIYQLAVQHVKYLLRQENLDGAKYWTMRELCPPRCGSFPDDTTAKLKLLLCRRLVKQKDYQAVVDLLEPLQQAPEEEVSGDSKQKIEKLLESCRPGKEASTPPPSRQGKKAKKGVKKKGKVSPRTRKGTVVAEILEPPEPNQLEDKEAGGSSSVAVRVEEGQGHAAKTEKKSTGNRVKKAKKKEDIAVKTEENSCPSPKLESPRSVKDRVPDEEIQTPQEVSTPYTPSTDGASPAGKRAPSSANSKAPTVRIEEFIDGMVYFKERNYERALPRLEEALRKYEIMAHEMGESETAEVDVLMCRRMIGHVLSRTGKDAEALALRQECLKDYSELKGIRNPIALDLMHDVAVSMARLQQHDEAVRELQKIQRSSRQSLGRRRDLAGYLAQARIHANLGKWDQALEIAQDASEKCRTELGERDILSLSTIFTAGFCLHRAGKDADAYEMLMHTAHLFEEVLGSIHSKTLHAKYFLASCLGKLEKVEEAINLLEQILPTLEETGNPLQAKASRKLAILLRLVANEPA